MSKARGSKDLSFFFQAEDGIRDRSPSRGLGDVYKRQSLESAYIKKNVQDTDHRPEFFPSS